MSRLTDTRRCDGGPNECEAGGPPGKADAVIASAQAELVVPALELFDIALTAHQIAGERIEHPHGAGAVQSADVGAGGVGPDRVPQHQRAGPEPSRFSGKSSGRKPNSGEHLFVRNPLVVAEPLLAGFDCTDLFFCERLVNQLLPSEH